MNTEYMHTLLSIQNLEASSFKKIGLLTAPSPFPRLSVGRTFRGQDLEGLILFRCPSLTNVYTVGSQLFKLLATLLQGQWFLEYLYPLPP